ncbi:hypothetical protein [Polaribacter cellanae]|uniref:Uncharacterized protein n=1 Tax=Polaribacter cellanae TaxID=2818493 RepID=A0A975CS04_9FLAO|nr:hypothetical protein [Polaribacter cellanae]QTE24295.1 hypothetical protein J3359_08555 [Polaribacter cellanae]
MKYLFLKTILFLFALTLSNCEKNDPEDQLPPITQTGANTFGAIVDGRVFIPKDSKGFVAPGGRNTEAIRITSGVGLNNTNYYAIAASNFVNSNIYIYIYIPEERPRQKEYIFHLSPGVPSSLNKPNFPHIFCYLNDRKYISFENSGTINFEKVDFIEQICAGNFSAKLKNEMDENDTIEIKNGQFDLICTIP